MNTSPERHTTLARLALPLLLNSILGLVTTLIDTMIISAHSKEAAAAVSLANQILVAAYDFSVLLGVGATVMISHAIGRGSKDEARSIASIAIAANAVLGVFIALLLVALGPLLIDLVNVPSELQAETLTYIHVIAIAMPFNGFLMASVSCLRGFSFTRVILMLGVFAFPSYLLLDYVLVLGAGPVPALGVFGSALATLIVRVSSVLVLLFVLSRVIGLSWRLPRAAMREALATLRRLVSLSSPSVLDNVAYGFYQLVLVSFIAGLGVGAVVSRFYAIAVTAFLPVVIMAVSQANEVLVGYRFGAGQREDVYGRAWRSGAIAAVVSTGCAVLIFLFSSPLVGLFTDDAAVHAQARELLYLTIFIQPLSGLNTVLFHSLRVLGDVRAPVLFSQVVMWGLAAPLAWLLCVHLDFGVAGLWYAMIFEEAAKTLFMVMRWMRRSGLGSEPLPVPDGDEVGMQKP